MLTAGEISRGQIVTVYSWFQTHQEVHNYNEAKAVENLQRELMSLT